jgi:hypothetical protein
MNLHFSLSAAATPRQRPRPVKTVTQLYAEFVPAHEASEAARKTCNKADHEDLDRSFRAWNKYAAIGERLLRTTAVSPEEMLLQIRVTLALKANVAFESLTELDGCDDFENADLDAVLTLKYLRDGLRRLSASQAPTQ